MMLDHKLNWLTKGLFVIIGNLLRLLVIKNEKGGAACSGRGPFAMKRGAEELWPKREKGFTAGCACYRLLLVGSDDTSDG